MMTIRRGRRTVNTEFPRRTVVRFTLWPYNRSAAHPRALPNRHKMSHFPPSDPDAARFRRRLAVLAVIASLGLAALTARLVWLQALQ